MPHAFTRLIAFFHQDLRLDIRYGLRILFKNPGFTFVAVTTLALGIGANTAMFTIVRAVLLRPLPYRDPERLVAIWDRVVREKGMSKIFAQYRDLELWREHSESFEQLAGITWAVNDRIMTGHGAARSVLAAPTTVDLFNLLGVAPMVGRTFEPADLSRGCTVVLTHRIWHEVLSAQRNLHDLTLALDDQACTVAGVMPPGFAFYPEATALWVLVTPNDSMGRAPERTGGLGVFGRLKPGVSVAGAQAELQVLSNQIDRGVRYGTPMEPMVYPLQEEFTFLAGRNLRLSLVALFGAVSCVLLIACVNVANLLLGRSLGRHRELAIRAALGCGRSRLMRQLLVESLALSAIATAVGTLLAIGAVSQLTRLNPIELPVGANVAINIEVLTFAALLTIVTTMVFGLMPAWRASLPDLQSALKSAGRGSGHDGTRRRLTKGLIVAEISLSLVLLVGAGLFIESVVFFTSAPLGFEPDGLMTMSLKFPSNRYQRAEEKVFLFDHIMNQLRIRPDVRGVALSTVPPLRSARGSRALIVEARLEPTAETAVREIGVQSVTQDYFAVMGIPLRSGREFESGDRPGAAAVAIVNDALVRKYFANDDPIGKHIRFTGDLDHSNPWLTIVGVVASEKRPTPYQEMAWNESLYVYRPLAQHAANDVSIVWRSRAEPAGLATIQQQVRDVDPTLVVGDTQTAQHLIARYHAYPRFRAVLLGVFAGLALFLAVVGLYAVLCQLVVQRTHEIGVRMALGARARDVVGSVMKEGMALAGLGVTIGLLSAWWLARFLASLLFGVRPHDPLTLGGVSVVLLAAAFLATYLPARRAARVDPMVALRCE